MIQIRKTVRKAVPGMKAMPKREWNRIRKLALAEVEAYWRANILPRHFTKEGAAKYDYTPRGGEGQTGKKFWRSYTGRKQKFKGHQRPLVWSGKSEQRAKRKTFSATASGNRAVLIIKIDAPALNFRNPYSDVNMREEIIRITPDELRELEKVYANAIARLLNARANAAPRTIVFRDGQASGSGAIASLSA